MAVQVLFGAWPVAAKLAFTTFHPIALSGLRTAGGALVLLLLARVFGRRYDPRKNWRPLVLFTLLAVVANQFLFIVGLARTTAVHATLIVATIPLTTYAVAVALGKERLGPRRVAGLVVAMGGVAWLIGAPGEGGLVGDLLVLANGIAFSIFLVISGDHLRRHDSLAVTAWMFVLGSVILLPIAILAGLPQQATEADGLTWALVAFIIIGPTVLTYWLNAVSLRAAPASTVAGFIFLQPLMAAALAAWLLDEALSWRLIPAALAVLAGLLLLARARAKPADDSVVGLTPEPLTPKP